MTREKPGQALLVLPISTEAGERGPLVDPNARAPVVGLSNARFGFAGIVRSRLRGPRLRRPRLLRGDGRPAAGIAPRRRRRALAESLKAIFASVLDTPVRDATREEAGAAGAAMMGAVALGLHPDLKSCCRTFVDPTLGTVIAQNSALVPLYGRLFDVYRRLRADMRPVWRDLAGIGRPAPTREVSLP